MSVYQYVTLVLILAGLSTTLCATTWDNACAVGGSLVVFSVPGDLPVTAHYCDRVYDKEAFQLLPRVKFLEAKPEETYSLVMIDPDAPDRPAGVYYLHWIVANIPGEDLRSGNLKNATVITSYLGPAPPEGTGLHRYMFFVYRHSPTTGRLSRTIGDPERQFFNLRAWLQSSARLGVRLRGPFAGVQFRAGFQFIASAAVL